MLHAVRSVNDEHDFVVREGLDHAEIGFEVRGQARVRLQALEVVAGSDHVPRASLPAQPVVLVGRLVVVQVGRVALVVVAEVDHLVKIDRSFVSLLVSSGWVK